MDRTKIDNFNNVIIPNKSASAGFTAIPLSTHVDETIISFVRVLPDGYNYLEEETIFNELKSVENEINAVNEKYNYWIILSAIFIITLYGLIPFIILRKKKFNLLDSINNRYICAIDKIKNMNIVSLNENN